MGEGYLGICRYEAFKDMENMGKNGRHFEAHLFGERVEVRQRFCEKVCSKMLHLPKAQELCLYWAAQECNRLVSRAASQ